VADELERMYELLYLLPVGVVAFEADGAVTAANPLAVQLLNPFVAPAATANAFTLLEPLVADLAGLIAGRPDGPVVLANHRSTLTMEVGPVITVELSVHRPRPDYFVAVLSDVTELARREHQLSRERDRIRVIVEMVHDYAIYTIDRAGLVDSWNASGQRLFGLTTAEATGRPLTEIVSVDHLDDALEAAVFAGWHRIEGWAAASPGQPFYTDTMISTLVDEVGRPEGFIIVTRDATEVRRREEDLRREADTDPLTSVANRRGFDARAIRLIAACHANGLQASVLMIDIDHFKAVNDTYGHDGGDIVLRAVSATLSQHLRAIDLLGRVGGEEFAVLLSGAGREAATTRAEALRLAVADLRIEVAPRTTAAVTISVGVAAHGAELLETLRRADVALYRAKGDGRNRVSADELPG
jgi:diguanylate cyclase (GGDEF)-like protein/PAS domain S-box-containing protein